MTTRTTAVRNVGLLLIAGTTGVLGACYSPYDNYYAPLTDPAMANGGGGTGGGTPSGCDPSTSSKPVDGNCGVFVSSSKGNDSNDGSKEKPFATVSKATLSAAGKPIYLCAETFTEAVVQESDAVFFGGLDCTQDWAHVGPDKKTTWTAMADAVPLHVVIGARVALTDIAFAAVDATKPGGSSIAVIAEDGTQVELTNCDVSAGKGADGGPGEAPSGTGMAGTIGVDGGGSCTSAVGEFGGPGGQLACENIDVGGGQGGNGNTTSPGGDGSKGHPVGDQGIGGLGQGSNVDCMTDGKGGDGAPGTAGDSGQGAPMSLGTLSAQGYTGVPGADGKPGQPGQGGGGGGGGKGCANAKAGPSGGGGGSGGCGGSGGKGGSAGGASIGIVSLGAKLTLDTVKITVGAGGKGGAGGDGQPGGSGGAGGMPGPAEAGNGSKACGGGKGGDGGIGGKGGGGRGGHSIGIAHSGDAPDTKGASIEVGVAGDGGEGDGVTGTGAVGVAAPVQAF